MRPIILLYHPIQKTLDYLSFDENYDAIGELDGIEIIERRNRWKDYKNRHKCDWYVFRERLQEPWYDTLSLSDMFDIWHNTERFLAEKKYRPTEQPINGDVVAYRSGSLRSLGPTEHFGIFEGETVVSKWASGHVFRHPLAHIPLRWGLYVTFFRKEEGKTDGEELK